MYQVCFTAGFAEWGKGSWEGYSIYYYARRCARVWFVRKRSGTVKIPAGWDEKYSGRMEFFIGWHEKNPEILPEEGKNGSSAREIHAEKSGFFLWKAPEKVRKWWKRGEKFLSLHGEKHENYPDDEEKHVRNWVMGTEKSGFFFWKNSGEA